LRFDDMLATVLAQPEGDAAARLVKWRQLVDLLAQPGRGGDAERLEQVLTYLRTHRGGIDPDKRKEIARTLVRRRVNPLIVRFFAEDAPEIAAPLIIESELSTEEWIELLPSLNRDVRAALRERVDLQSEVAQAMDNLGSHDLALLPPPVPASEENGIALRSPAAEGGEAQIRELVARIEEFRRERNEWRASHEPASDREEPESPRVENFRWEAGPDGVIHWVEGAPRGPLIGQTIAGIAGPGAYGVDGQAAGAFEKRSPFRNARFRVAGRGPVGGDWRISGVPYFDPARGSFLGYRGSARRPRLDEVARTGSGGEGSAGVFGTDVPADALRQLIHELRTPLNAIVGFAELIDGQYMGPAASRYRSRAKDIMEQAGKLLVAVDDLDTAARIETRRLVLEDSAFDAAALLSRLQGDYAHVAARRNAIIDLECASGLPHAKVEVAAAERMFARLLAATIGLAEEGERISAALTTGTIAGRTMLRLAIDRPKAIAGKEESALLDPGYSPEGDWPGAPTLGLGFALRLVRNLADAAGGALAIGDQSFLLFLPAAEPVEQSFEQEG
jgi:hypothetical protein